MNIRRIFQYVQSLWRPFSVDRFAYYQKAKLTRFNSKFWSPDSEAVNCFLVSWTGENNYLVPSVHVVVMCLRPLLQCKAEGTLITPTRPSVFGHFLFPEVGKRAAFFVDFKLIAKGGIFAEGPLKSKLFSRDKVKSVLIVKLDGSRKGLVVLKYEIYSVVCLGCLLHAIICHC